MNTGWQSLYERTLMERDVAREEIQRLWRELTLGCDGTGECAASWHVHGCFNDFGRCDKADEHKEQ